MTKHTKTDGPPAGDGDTAANAAAPALLAERAASRNERMASDKIKCNACPVLCQISRGKAGACGRYANAEGVAVRVDPVVLLRKTL